MKQISNEFSGTYVCLDKSNVDTDQIIPKQFLKSIKKTGFGENLFDAWRYLDEGSLEKKSSKRIENDKFILNNKIFLNSSILVARENFGCGSSREHAVWALKDFGIKTVIAESFADIFYNNCFKNGLLAITLDTETIEGIFKNFDINEANSLEIDLINQKIYFKNKYVNFKIDDYKKNCLLEGLDEIGSSLKLSNQIKLFERNYKKKNPWLFK